MTLTATKAKPDHSPEIVQLALNGGRVTANFRAALFAAAGREGVSVNEFVLRAVAKVLQDRGSRFEGVFETGDIEPASRSDPSARSGQCTTRQQFGTRG